MEESIVKTIRNFKIIELSRSFTNRKGAKKDLKIQLELELTAGTFSIKSCCSDKLFRFNDAKPETIEVYEHLFGLLKDSLKVAEDELLPVKAIN